MANKELFQASKVNPAIDLESVRQEKEHDTNDFLSKIGLSTQCAPISFTANSIEEVRKLGGDIEWIPRGINFNRLKNLGPLFSSWWEDDVDLKDDFIEEGHWLLWIPEILNGSLNKPCKDQEALLSQWAESLGLLPQYGVLGEALDLTYLIFLHYKRTGKALPTRYDYVRSASPKGMKRLDLGYFDWRGLSLTYGDPIYHSGSLGVFPLAIISK